MCDLRKSSERHHCLDRCDVGGVNCGGTAQLTLVLGRLLGKDVALERLTPLDGPASANLKALGGAFLGFHLGHNRTLFAANAGGIQTILNALPQPGVCLLVSFASGSLKGVSLQKEAKLLII